MQRRDACNALHLIDVWCCISAPLAYFRFLRWEKNARQWYRMYYCPEAWYWLFTVTLEPSWCTTLMLIRTFTLPITACLCISSYYPAVQYKLLSWWAQVKLTQEASRCDGDLSMRKRTLASLVFKSFKYARAAIRDVGLCLKFPLAPSWYYVSEQWMVWRDSAERRLAWAFTVRLSDKYLFPHELTQTMWSIYLSLLRLNTMFVRSRSN